MKKISLALRATTIQESVTLALNTRAQQLRDEGQTIFNLTAGELSENTPSYIQSYVAKKLSHNKYTPVAGLPDLRSAVAEHARQFYGLPWITAQNVVVTGGAKPALYATLLALINPGDEVIVPVPAWVSYMDLIELVGGKVVTVPLTEQFDIDPKAIAHKLSPKTKAIILNSPHNPTGALFSAGALKSLKSVLADAIVTVISDDIYATLVYEDSFRPVPTFGFERYVIINGFSKSQALTGWRIGYVVADTPLATAITNLLSHITGNAALPSQYAAISALEHFDQPPAETLKSLHARRTEVMTALADIPGLSVVAPGGAFYFFLDVRKLNPNSQAWCRELLNQSGVALVPGEAFLSPGFARLSFSVDQEVLSSALPRIKDFVHGNKARK